MSKQYDVIIIGAGVIGSAVAREMSRYGLKICVLEKGEDVATGNSSRNTGMLHAGFTYKPGTLKAVCAVEGNREFDRVARELGVPFRRTGKLVIGFTGHDRENILRFMHLGEKNGVEGMRMIDKEEIAGIEPSAGGEFAMYVPSSGLLDPMEYTIALAENAHQNGVEFLFGQEVVDVAREGESWKVVTGTDVFETCWVINCAAQSAEPIGEMLGFGPHRIRTVKGEYFILDKKAGRHLSIPVYPAPDDNGGFATHATPTVDGNVLIGPEYYETREPEDYSVTKLHLDNLIRDGQKMFKEMKREYFIRNFAGVRWQRIDPETGKFGDFVLDFDPDRNPGAVSLVGIDSPGITSALPLARRVTAKVTAALQPEEKTDFNPVRPARKRFYEMTREEQRAAIEENPLYGEIICRCENVTKAEIQNAVNNPLGVCTVTAVKNRTRATMGRCQGGYCETRITEMIEQLKGIAPGEVRYSSRDSYIFTGKVRD